MNFLRKPYKYSFFNATAIIIVLCVLMYVVKYFFSMRFSYLCSLNVNTILYNHAYWQFFTYMFVHADFFHILFNMLTLFCIGTAVEKAIGSKEFLTFYFVTGTIAGLLSFLVYWMTDQYNVFLMGASGAIYAVLFAYAVIFPSSNIMIWGIIPVKAPLLVIIYAVIDLASQIYQPSNIAHITHLFGLLAAWLYMIVRMGVKPVHIWINSFKK